LLPWKGSVRNQRTTTFLLDQDNSSYSMDHGVCAMWETKKGDASATISLAHAYASEATPIPTIEIHFKLKLKVLEFSMCTLALSCGALMKCPGKWMGQWFMAAMQDSANDSLLFGQDQISMIELEAVFMPEDQSLGTSFVSIGQHEQAPVDSDTDLNVPMTSGDVFSEKTYAKVEAMISSQGKTMNDKLVPSGKAHLLRVKKFWKPASCGQCTKSLLGWRQTSFRCEACGLDCCSDCRLHVDVQLPCGSSKAVEIVGKLIQNKLTMRKFLEAMAPVDEEYEQRKREPGGGELSLAETRTETGTLSRVAADESGRVGVLKLNVIRACVFRKAISPVTEPQEVTEHTGELRPGDYYVRVFRTGSGGSSRTRTIPSSGILKFEETSEMRLDV